MAIAPLQIPQSNINNAVDPSQWTSLGNLGNVYKDAQAAANKQRILSSLGTDPQANMQALLTSQDPGLAQIGLNLQQRQTEYGREDQRYAVTDARANAQLAIQQAQEERAAKANEEDTPTWRAQNLVKQGIDPNTPEGRAYIVSGGKYAPPDAANQYEIKEVENNGIKSLVRVRKQGAEGVIPGTEPGPLANPFVSGGGKGMNHDQAQAASYTDRMAEAHQVINKFETINKGIGTATGTALEVSKGVPAALAPVRNWFLSGDRQQFDQAKRNFVNAILRKESGAAISPSEFANAEQQYFPQPGDSEDVIALKQQNRLTAMHGMAREAGAAYQPPEHIIPPELRRPSSGQGSGADEALRLARNDLANRVPRAQVEARLKAQGIDPSEIDKVPQKAKTVTRTGTVNSGPNKGKTAVQYSDGSIEYQ
jgi:hypothetical protein